jgi:hypothetical protein
MEVKLPFYPITPKSVIADELFAFALSTGSWQPYYNFSAVQVPFELAFSDPVLAGIGAKHSLAVGIVRLDPYTTYDWHTDTKRGVSINMLLNDVKSNCLFSVDEAEATHEFLELKYQPKTYYVFNNQVPHMVINFAQTRYLMSVEFKADKDELTFDQFGASND